MTIYTANPFVCAQVQPGATETTTRVVSVPAGTLWCTSDAGTTYEVSTVEETTTVECEGGAVVYSDTAVIGYRISTTTGQRAANVRRCPGARTFRNTKAISAAA